MGFLNWLERGKKAAQEAVERIQGVTPQERQSKKPAEKPAVEKPKADAPPAKPIEQTPTQPTAQETAPSVRKADKTAERESPAPTPPVEAQPSVAAEAGGPPLSEAPTPAEATPPTVDPPPTPPKADEPPPGESVAPKEPATTPPKPAAAAPVPPPASPQKTAPARPTEKPAAKAPPASDPPPIVAPKAEDDARPGFFSRFVSGLSKTRRKVVDSIRSVLPFGRKIDETILEKLEQQLYEGDLGVDATTNLIDQIREAHRAGEIETTDDILPFLKRRIAAAWPDDDTSIALDTKPAVVLIVGVNGSGKTTTIAKLSHQLQQAGKNVLVAACDTFRAGAVMQLETWAERAGVQIVRHSQGSDPAAVAYDACDATLARDVDVMIVDTAGRLHTQSHLMQELEKIRRVIAKKIPGAPHETLLVLDATTGQNALQQAKMFDQICELSGIVLTKLDGSAKGGVVIAIRNEVDVPVKFVGLGEGIHDLQRFDPVYFAASLFGEAGEEEEQEAAASR